MSEDQTTEGPYPPPGELDLEGVLLDGRYRVGQVLGRGGMAVVYEARHARLGHRVVVKVPHSTLLRDSGFRKRFDAEINAQVALEHPGIAKVLDRGVYHGAPYVVIQHLGGGSLRRRIHERQEDGRVVEVAEVVERQGPREVLAWLTPVAKILDFVHARDLVHRDVKPSNILYDKEGNVFLADFGIVKALGRPDETLTLAGVMPGTPDYMPPEQAKEKHISGRADQYALASTVYRLLAGRLPYDKGTPVLVLASKMHKEPLPLLQATRDVPKEIAAVVMRALSRDPEDRYASCGAFAAAFEEATEKAEAAAAAAQPLHLPGARLLAPVLVALLAALAAMAIAFLVNR